MSWRKSRSGNHQRNNVRATIIRLLKATRESDSSVGSPDAKKRTIEVLRLQRALARDLTGSVPIAELRKEFLIPLLEAPNVSSLAQSVVREAFDAADHSTEDDVVPEVVSDDATPSAYILLPCGGPIALMRLTPETVDILFDCLASPAITETQARRVSRLLSLHRITEEYIDHMVRGPQMNMARAAIHFQQPLIINESSRSIWDVPINGEPIVERVPGGLMVTFVLDDGEKVMTDRSLDVADVQWLALALSTRADFSENFRKLSTLAPEMAFTTLGDGLVIPYHPDFALNSKQVMRRLTIEDLRPMVKFDEFGVGRMKQFETRLESPIDLAVYDRVGEECPQCSRGLLTLRCSRVDRRPFMACHRYLECDYFQWIESPDDQGDHQDDEPEVGKKHLSARDDPS